ncbi:testis-expressed protein 11-like [Clavelina lepadiformis]|uniref:testis-expressed protein 11-like n=1 Tax=Clavelina lepadiformis TaxID=159417 RepID=UPI004041653F
MDSVIGKLTSFAASAECITKSLEECKTSDDVIIKNASSVNEVLKSQWMANFWKTNENLSNSQNNFQLKFFSSQLEEVVVGLWNATVTRQTTKSIQDKTIATLRQLCYDLLSSPLCANVRPTDPRHSTYLHRRVMMATKAGKGWMDIGNYECAEAILLRAKEDSEKLQALFKSSSTVIT